ncbi:type 4a pilus biogenesis protein PilO [Psychromonas sp. 14N.309.X.WAT.B.A12]|uniref:type 4a pilus biogenesis protein PilO n=1 Tax=unclassified Psychromonas TaxID=2614957 RepID=UPI0025B16A79|nr:type 4a pilus biogenesis protein PilO [Psychromonas sp. 14N.309.X.WAT.B.A12]MDN2664031.1 type 4a pilus biogenesis protein PilO [Psychromonas sp. 14N.309.X.WAT.B.A12]
MHINDMDFDNVGSWPKLHKTVVIAIVCILLIGGFYYYVIEDQLKQLDKVEAKELALKNEFKVKAALSSNLEAYREQMTEIEVILAGLVNKLPTKKELASLLDDIGFIGANNGLQFKSLNWGVKKQLELAEEVPISIKVVGTYEQLGKFSADIAALPRIVILDNLRLKHNDENTLMLDIVAKTYQYKGHK